MTEIKSVIKLLLMEKMDIVLSVLFGFLTGIAAVGLFASSGYFITTAALLPPFYVLTIFVAMLKLFSVARAFSRYAERYYSHRATFTFLSNVRTYFYQRLEPLAPTLFQRYRSGDLLARIVGDVESLQHFFLRVWYPPILMVFVFFATIVFTLFFSMEIAFLLFIGVLLTGFIIPFLFLVRQKEKEAIVRDKRGELSTEATELLYGFVDLKLFQQLPKKERELLVLSEFVIQKQKQRGAEEAFSHSINHSVCLFISWCVIVIGVLLVTTSELDAVFLAMLVLVSLAVFENAVSMTEVPSYYEDSRKAAKRLSTIIDESPSVQIKRIKQGSFPTNKAPYIEWKQVTFSYPGEARPALKDINLLFPARSKTAIVGPSGSGKSTVLSLLLKMYEPNDGKILISGENVNVIEEEYLWKQINPVLQSNHLFYGTVQENIRLANEDVSDKEISDVLSVVNLPFSLETKVLEKGSNLSGGEKQRIAIARALIKGGKLWLLDEPTSSIDTLTERRIYHHLFHKYKDDTMIFVSHRLTGLEQMDQIVVLDRGQVVETGTFSELMKKKGYFYEMKQIEKSVF